jgi:RNA polymerase sigma factor for flagellar operon FliA
MKATFEEMLKEHTNKIYGMATHVSRGFGGGGTLDDLVAAGNEALWRCYLRFDAKRLPEEAFWVYAQNRVRGAMLDSLRETDNLSRYERELIKTGKAEEIPWAALHRVSLENLNELMSDSDPHEDLVKRLDVERARTLIVGLPPKSQRVIQMYYGEEMTLASIGRCLKITESRVCQIKKETLKLVRTLLLSP